MGDDRKEGRGRWAAGAWRVLRSVVPVLVTYPVALYFLLEGERAAGIPPPSEREAHPVVTVVVVAFVTFVFAVGPLALVMTTTRARELAEKTGLRWKTIVLMVVGGWYSFPYIAVALAAHPIVLAGAVLNVALARRGTRAWVFIEYSVVCISLFIYTISFASNPREALSFGPLFYGAAGAQVLILAIADWSWRERFIRADDDSDPESGEDDPSDSPPFPSP